ncbi:DUF5829 family protein [Lacibacter sediminis]|uniref:Uncharacterized protein n=1 Tax=Lacibacter sediminis TaxID=2760713 RepID=A0A7G5XIN8_9BACT|nr:DUF5829 family protein [Lacibacter sediminis]QNA45341.1 hypothetical protein H4075_03845 [Lacibacter sediminis]
MRRILSICSVLIFSALACNEAKPKIDAPSADPGHIGFVLDSAAYFDLLNDSFLTNEFAQLFVDTSHHPEPLIELYLTGREAFLNVGLAKEFWQGKEGKGIMMFQTRKPGEIDNLIRNWKQSYTDSLNSYVHDGGGFKIAEVTPFIKKNDPSSKEPNLSILLASYTIPTYKSWGFSDSAIANGVAMKDFMNSWDSRTQNKLFKKFKSFHIQLTEKELEQIESGLISVGYRKEENVFKHDDNVPVYFTVTPKNEIPKYTRIEIELAESTTQRIIQLGNMYTIHIKNKEMVIEQTK